MVEEYRNQKSAKQNSGKKKNNGRAMRLGGESIDYYSGLFSATFCVEEVEATVLADQDSDANSLQPHVLPLILETTLDALSRASHICVVSTSSIRTPLKSFLVRMSSWVSSCASITVQT